VFDLMHKFRIGPEQPDVFVATNVLPKFWKYFSLLTDSIVSWGDIESRCFDRVAVGLGRSSVSGRPADSAAIQKRLFRNLAWKRAQLPEAPPSSPYYRILFLEKNLSLAEHHAYWANQKQIIQDLKAARPRWIITSVQWPGMSIPEQLRVIQATDVIVTLPGSDVVNGLFLPDNSGIIMPCRREGLSFSPSNEVTTIFATVRVASLIALTQRRLRGSQPSSFATA